VRGHAIHRAGRQAAAGFRAPFQFFQLLIQFLKGFLELPGEKQAFITTGGYSGFRSWMPVPRAVPLPGGALVGTQFWGSSQVLVTAVFLVCGPLIFGFHAVVLGIQGDDV